MKRDMDLIRELLLKLEAWPMRTGDNVHVVPDAAEIQVAGYTGEQIDYHLNLLRDDGFLDCPRSQPMLGIMFCGLTWKGHDFLDSIRDPKIWRETKEGAEKAGGFSLDLLAALAKGLIKKKIEQHTGVALDL